ncbi:hypothetical protein [Paenibacillus sp. NAIST15-1]|uniref:hypothetical protein n=1 Tax=Paenibacillus sp. NAIST15-1 TaxID=1605994 RepID=UPI0011153CFB|nr:hypothetical protein [Paenibacillus sp. NAIST15-1]
MMNQVNHAQEIDYLIRIYVMFQRLLAGDLDFERVQDCVFLFMENFLYLGKVHVNVEQQGEDRPLSNHLVQGYEFVRIRNQLILVRYHLWKEPDTHLLLCG